MDTRIEMEGWTCRIRPATDHPTRLVVLLHGWTGDENSMWLFTRKIPGQYAILLPRAPFPTSAGGFSWRDISPGTWGLPSLDDLRPSAEKLLAFLDIWISATAFETKRLDVVGFSQGAAMAYCMALLFPGRVDKIVALAGFLPSGSETRLGALDGKQVFIAHGREDDLVPIERARQAQSLLKDAGIPVTYCESDGGHKVNSSCLKRMESFFIIG